MIDHHVSRDPSPYAASMAAALQRGFGAEDLLIVQKTDLSTPTFDEKYFLGGVDAGTALYLSEDNKFQPKK